MTGDRRCGRGRLVAAALAALALVAVAACGGGGGGGGGGGTTPPPPPPSGITFTPAASTTPNGIALRSVGTTSTHLSLEVRAEGVTGLYGAGFDITYPAGLFRLAGSAEGTFLNQSGAATSFQIAQPSPGRLIVGITRLGALGGVSGSGPLLTLELDATANGTGAFAFENAQAFAADGSRITLQFNGGSAQVNL